MRRVRTTVVIAIVASCIGTTTAAEHVDCAALLNKGRSALDERQFATAASAFDQLSAHCGDASQRPTDHPFEFYTALARQLEASTPNVEPGRRSALLADAERLYVGALSIAPADRAILNNLALVYNELGRRAEAQSAFERALEAGGATEPWYMTTYARFLIQGQQYEEAAKYLQGALKLNPSLLEAQIGIFELRLSKDGPEAALTGLAQLAVKTPEHVSRIVIDTLSDAKWDPVHKQLAFALAISAMASELTRSPSVSDALRELLRSAESDVVVGIGARELSPLLSAAKPDPASFAWWAARAAQQSPTDLPLWQAFHSFALAAGVVDARASNYPAATAKYLLVLRLEYPRVSTDPVLRLAELYAAARDGVSFTDLVSRYDNYMTSVADSTDATTLRKRYDYHREMVAMGDALLDSLCTTQDLTVGVTATTLTTGMAPEPVCIQLAELVVKEVEKTTDAARKYNASLARSGSAVELDGGAFAAAAHGYNVLGEQHRAVTARITAAEMYVKARKSGSAHRELDRIEKEGLARYMSADEFSLFSRLRESITVPQTKK